MDNGLNRWYPCGEWNMGHCDGQHLTTNFLVTFVEYFKKSTFNFDLF